MNYGARVDAPDDVATGEAEMGPVASSSSVDTPDEEKTKRKRWEGAGDVLGAGGDVADGVSGGDGGASGGATGGTGGNGGGGGGE